jgi:hypothetical protein
MQAQNGVMMYMKDWVDKLDTFLQFNEKDILNNCGKISHEVAVKLAENEYEKFRKFQNRIYESDYDQTLNNLLIETKK